MSALTLAEVRAAFEIWEKDFRAQPEGFYTPDEVAAMEIGELSDQRAIHFLALLRNLKKEKQNEPR